MSDLIPFGFARRFGILLDRHTLLMRNGASLESLSEALRVVGQHVPLRVVDDDAFAIHLAGCYGGAQDAAQSVIQEPG